MTATDALEKIMRFVAPAVALSLALATVSSVSFGKRIADDQINPLSMSLTKAAITDAAAGRLEQANDSLETALAVDPRNRAAYVELASVARKQGLPGKAIRLYREALLIEPDDIIALAGQGEALVQKGAVTRAKENLARIQKICMNACPEQTRLASAIEKGSTQAIVSAQAVAPTPSVSAADEKKAD
jgi:tetratricopeptide (TPR) repeat protein